MKLKLNILPAMLALGLVGCAGLPTLPDATTTHPANARAAEGAFPPPEPSLTSGSDALIANSASDPAPEHQLDHGTHGMKPKTEEPK